MTWPGLPNYGEAPTTRELQVVRCLAKGFTNEELGRYLRVSQYTIKNHLARIGAKLCASGRSGIVGAAYEEGWLLLPDAVVLAQADAIRRRQARLGRAA